MDPNEILRLPPCVLLLTGFPGVGKLTIAKIIAAGLASVIPSGFSSVRVIDYQVLLLPVEDIAPGRDVEHYKVRQRIRDVAFKSLKEASNPNLRIIMTRAVTFDLEYDAKQFNEYAALAKGRGVPLFTVDITCNEDVNIERLCSEERRQAFAWGCNKLVNEQTLLNMRKEHRLLDPKEVEGNRRGSTIVYKVVDTSDYTAEEAAAKIVRACLQSSED
ncbi:hypothetical protein VTL71DRAFT_14361 [Oculimacula yallundae]|uniref:Uncharacterized protein n=1 Tax=Oculimacula yallundae TaxID=86028 RepID=A0ABR4CI86_9HELO